MKNRDIYWKRYKIQETLYIGQWCLGFLQSRHLGTSHSSPNLHQLPCHIFLNLINGLKSLPFQRWFQCWEKARSHRAPNLDCREAGSPGGFDVSAENSAGDVIHGWAHCPDGAAHPQLPTAAAFWVIHTVSVEKRSSLMQNWTQICCSTLWVILNVMTTQYTCSFNCVYCPHWLE